MATSLHHAKSSVRRWGGTVDDYLPIHQWFDETKAFQGDWRHRALRHHTLGIFEAQKVFGVAIQTSEGKEVTVRQIGEQHVMEDCGGRIPTPSDWLRKIGEPERWMLAPEVPGLTDLGGDNG